LLIVPASAISALPGVEEPEISSHRANLCNVRAKCSQVGCIETHLARAILESMLDNFSKRARQIVFAARLRAGERGAKTIDTDDLLVGLVLEDQGTLEKTVFSAMFEGQGMPVNRAQSHVPFLSVTVAQHLLANLEKGLLRSQRIALTTEVPLSLALEQVFSSAKDVRTRFRHNQIEPLHLLAAILAEGSGQGVKLLQDSGVTHEKVLRTLSGTTEK
jgi:Clp amino terminal domain, pathogenicity island component